MKCSSECPSTTRLLYRLDHGWLQTHTHTSVLMNCKKTYFLGLLHKSNRWHVLSCVPKCYGPASATARGAWTVKGVKDWNHATEMLKQHNASKCHKDSVVSARMAEQAKKTGTVVDLHLAASAKQAEAERQTNRAGLMKLLRSIYFLTKKHIPHTTIFEDIIELQIANGQSRDLYTNFLAALERLSLFV